MKTQWTAIFSKLFSNDKKAVNLLIIAGVAGMLLLAVSEWLPAKSTAAPAQAQADTTVAQYEQQLETRLATLLGQVDGAGKVQVMVTLATKEETVYAQDTRTDENSTQQEHVLVNSGDTPALVETVDMPQIQGVAVVCEGGANPAVESRITQVVDVLTGVGASHISVTQMIRDK